MRSRTTTQRGYGRAHQDARKKALARMRDGDPCSRCGGPMYHGQPLHLDHDDSRHGYLGLSHARCNEAAGGRRSALARRQSGWHGSIAHNPSREW